MQFSRPLAVYNNLYFFFWGIYFVEYHANNNSNYFYQSLATLGNLEEIYGHSSMFPNSRPHPFPQFLVVALAWVVNVANIMIMT